MLSKRSQSSELAGLVTSAVQKLQILGELDQTMLLFLNYSITVPL